jgi:hypothetical protein
LVVATLLPFGCIRGAASAQGPASAPEAKLDRTIWPGARRLGSREPAFLGQRRDRGCEARQGGRSLRPLRPARRRLALDVKRVGGQANSPPTSCKTFPTRALYASAACELPDVVPLGGSFFQQPAQPSIRTTATPCSRQAGP